MKRSLATPAKIAAFLIAFLSAVMAVICAAAAQGQDESPVITVFDGDAIPVANPAPGVSERKIDSVSSSIRRLTFGVDGSCDRGASSHERFVFVLWGTVVLTSGEKSHTLGPYDMIILDGGSRFSCRSSGGAAEVIEAVMRSTGKSGDFPLESCPGTDAVFGYRELPFSFPFGDTLPVKIAASRNGFAAFERVGVNADRTLPRSSGSLSVVIRGNATLSPSTEPSGTIGEGDVLTCGPGGMLAIETPGESMELLTFIPTGDSRFAEAFAKQREAASTIIAPGTKPEVVVDGSTSSPRLTITEGPVWLGGRLYFSNYYMFDAPFGTRDEGGVCVWDKTGGYRVLNAGIQTCGMKPLAGGTIAACDIHNRSVVELATDGSVIRTIADSFEDIPLGMPNDVITDTKGGFYFTDPYVGSDGARKQPGTSVYYVDRDEQLTRVSGWNEFDFPNGCLISPDGGTFYLSCSREPVIWMFDIAADGALVNKRAFARVPEPDNPIDKDRRRGYGDGMTIDTDGTIYEATCYGVLVFDRNGTLLTTIVFPVSPSHCVFGGEDLSTLYATCGNMVYSIRTLRRGYQYPLE